MKPSFFFYDYETTGIDAKLDRVIQFAGIRTDTDFNIISEPIAKYSKLPHEIIPNPEALAVTGIKPDVLETEGLLELDFIRLIFQEFSKPNTCVAGYNNIKFDDEFTRNAFYRNFYDPYAREWQNNNSRFDLINIIRMCSALRPNGINWPKTQDGTISYKLEELSKANNLTHDKAHDALSDVYATIELAKLIKNKQPKLLDYLLNCRKKDFINNLMNLNYSDVKSSLIVHSSAMVKSEFHATSVFIPLMRDQTNKNSILTWDLRYDPSILLDVANDLDRALYLLYTKQENLKQGEQRLALKNIAINKVPAIAPISTLDSNSYGRIQLDPVIIKQRAELIIQNKNIWHNLLLELSQQKPDFNTPDVEQQLYNDFIPNTDKYVCNRVHVTPDDKLNDLESKFTDNRLKELLFRYRARNFYSTLDDQEITKWKKYCTERLDNSNKIASISKQEFINQSMQLLKDNQDTPDTDKYSVLSEWINYYKELE